MVMINVSTIFSGDAKKDPMTRAPPSTMSDWMPRSPRDLRMTGRERCNKSDDGGISIIRAPASSSPFFRSDRVIFWKRSSLVPSELSVVPS